MRPMRRAAAGLGLLLLTACAAPARQAKVPDFHLIEFRFPPTTDGTRLSVLCLTSTRADRLPPGVYECDVGEVR